jgi:excisionase family DNA binding protein
MTCWSNRQILSGLSLSVPLFSEQPDMDDTILTIKDVAAYLKVNERTVYRLAASGNIPAFKVGGSWRFRKDALEQWISEQSNQRIDDSDH